MSSSSAIFTAIGFLTPWRLLCDFFNDLLCCCCCFFLVDVVVCHSPWAANLLPPTGRRPGAVLRPSSSDGGGSRLTLTGDDQSTTFSSSAKTKSLSSYMKCIKRKRTFSCCFCLFRGARNDLSRRAEKRRRQDTTQWSNRCVYMVVNNVVDC